MHRYPPIGDHGLVGNLHTAALIAADGTADFLCLPAFDGPTVFASLLDAERGGHFQVGPAEEGYRARQMYLPDSAVLLTRFQRADGVVEVMDFMPVLPGSSPEGPHELVRLVRVVRGRVRLSVRCAPRFDYARGRHELTLSGETAVFRHPGLTLRLDSDVRLSREAADSTNSADSAGSADVVAEPELQAGGTAWFVLSASTGADPLPGSRAAADAAYTATIAFWRNWLSRSTYRGRWRAMVERSAITLKLLTYEPTGAIVAAPTFGLPEQTGGERNWDYRFTWVRDASLTVRCLLSLGYEDEGHRLFEWLAAHGIGSHVERRPSGDLHAQIMYRIDGSPDLPESTLDHLEGYRGSRPVRIGNGAAEQFQLDIFGEAVDAIWSAERIRPMLGHPGWTTLCRVADVLVDFWDRPDAGIWESRGGLRDHVYGRVMSWVFFDRMLRMAELRGRPGSTAAWSNARDAIYRQVFERGWDAKRQAFVQYYGGNVLDASLLAMPLVGFVAPNDPMWVSTLDAIRNTLVTDSLVYRYDPAASADGLTGTEGTFSLCTFWYVEALAHSRHTDEARFVFEKMLTYASPTGLYAEEVGLDGEQLGNFPQAFTHLALINAALALDARLDDADTRR